MPSRYIDGTKKFQCPVCGGVAYVYDTCGDGDSICRRRRCKVCNNQFRTIEIDMDLYQKLISPTSNNTKS